MTRQMRVLFLILFFMLYLATIPTHAAMLKEMCLAQNSIENTPLVRELMQQPNTVTAVNASSVSQATLKQTTTSANTVKVKGIYLTQYSLENTKFLTKLIDQSKTAGINTFVVDLETPNKRYRENIALVTQSGLNYIARIVMFPGGGTAEQINDANYWQKKYALAKQAIEWGAKEIQLDYIRFKPTQKPSSENAIKINEIIRWYRDKLAGQNIPLQVDVFGIASFGESRYIGQNIKLFSENVDAVCPMVYPSHYVPFDQHYRTPYETVYNSLDSIQDLMGDDNKAKLIPWIELSNYHYPMGREKRIPYIKAQLKAVEDAEADGWYAWSAHNRYDYLFEVLGNNHQ